MGTAIKVPNKRSKYYRLLVYCVNKVLINV